LAKNPAIGVKRVVERANNGVYIVIATDKADYEGLLERISQDKHDIELEQGEKAKMLLYNLLKENEKPLEYEKLKKKTNRPKQESNGVLIAYYKKVLPEYGFVYVYDKKGR